MNTISAGRILLSVTSLWSGVGSYVFDWNDTHIYNPDWPPHAKFHNAQTMSTGAALAAGGLLTLWGHRAPMTRARLQVATTAASLYWITQLSSTLYPGTAMVDHPLQEPGQDVRAPGAAAEKPPRFRGPQTVVASAALAINVLAYALERRRLVGRR